MLRARPRLRVLGPRDVDAVHALIARDPVTHVFVDHRVRLTRLEPRWLGGEMWGFDEGGELISLCHSAANLAPVMSTPAALDAYASRALTQGRRCGSILGPDDEVAGLWQRLRVEWGPARSVRPRQPFMTLSGRPLIARSPDVRRVEASELDVLYPACVAMYTEELGVSPEAAGGAGLYRARVAQLIARGHAFAHIEGGEVLFKAELGPVTPHAAQLQSVWVNSRYRGQGLAAPGVATICASALDDGVPVVSLYVNEHNVAARRTYSRVGFFQTGLFATILF
ncbi:MAG: GNAT family N-acetyltransferase [Nocardioidaceae bacterium]|nr:GNAT family N-acetyltransferase [Nocardioidaceae bacterium]